MLKGIGKEVRQALGLWRDELDKLESELETKLQRLAFLQEAPLPPDELADILIDRMTGLADHAFHAQIEKKIGAFLHKPLKDWRTQEKLAQARAKATSEWKADGEARRHREKAGGNLDSHVHSLFERSSHYPAFVGTTAADPLPLFWVLREPMANAVRDAILNWPDYPKAGPPLAERQKEIPKLERDIEKLRTTIEEERQAAEVAGVEAGGLHMRPSVRKANKAAQ